MSLNGLITTTQGAIVRSFKSRSIGASIAAFGLLLGLGVSGASANPTPDSGPTTGGTTVTLPAPEFKFTSVSAGVGFSMAGSSTGQAFSWGDNDYGQLGDGSSDRRNTPGPVSAPVGSGLSGPDAGAIYAVAMGSDGEAYAWGYLLGTGTPTWGVVNLPGQVARGAVPAGVRLEQISAGWAGTVAIGSDGNTYAWGDQILGDGTGDPSASPVRVSTPPGVKFVQVSSGNHYALALGDDGKAYAWGSGDYGALGDGTGLNRNVPVPVAQGAVPAGVKFVQVSAGEQASAAVGDDGKVYTWGMNGNSQLGDGSTVERTTPVQVSQGAVPASVKIVKVSSGGYFMVALGDDGKAYSWGGNNYHPLLGNGTTNLSSVPVQVSAGEVPAGVRLVAVDTALGGEDRHTLVLGDNGKIYAWGSNYFGELGNGENVNQSTPVAVLSPQVQVTGVTFDGLAGTSLSAIDANNKFTVVTPERHPGGKVDVVVSWTLGGVAQAPITYRLGYEYLASISITDPADQTVPEGGTATFSVASTSTPTPGTVIWQVSTDNGATWQPISADALASVSEGGHKLTVANAPLSHSGRLYRARVTSLDGQATSAPAKLTVTKQVDPLPPTITDPGPGSDAGPVAPNKIPKKLPSTGGFSVWYLVAGATLLVTGAGLTLSSRTRRKDAN